MKTLNYIFFSVIVIIDHQSDHNVRIVSYCTRKIKCDITVSENKENIQANIN